MFLIKPYHGFLRILTYWYCLSPQWAHCVLDDWLGFSMSWSLLYLCVSQFQLSQQFLGGRRSLLVSLPTNTLDPIACSFFSVTWTGAVVNKSTSWLVLALALPASETFRVWSNQSQLWMLTMTKGVEKGMLM